MTTVPATPPVSVETILRDAWALLRRNWILVAPLLLAFVAIFLVIVVIALAAAAIGGFSVAKNGTPTAAATGVIIVMIVAMFVAVLAVAAFATDALFGMADAVWTKGTATLGDGFAAARDRFGATLVSFVGFFGLALAALVLLIPTLGVSMLAFPVVTMYVLPAIVSGRRPGFAAFGESFALVRRYFGHSAIACLILIALQYLITIVMYVPILPLEFVMGAMGSSTSATSLAVVVVIGGLLAILGLVMIVILYAYQAFQALALVGIYRWLRQRADLEDAAPKA